MFEDILFVIAPIFLMAGIGYAINRSSLKLETESMGRLVVMVGTPSLVFSTLTAPSMLQVPVAGTVGAAVMVAAVSFVLSTVVLLVLRQPVRSFVSSLALPNSGNMGLPVVLLAFGDDGLAIGVAFFFVIAFCQYTFVPAILAGQTGITRLLKEPLLYALAAVFVFRMLEIPPHPILTQTTKLLGGMMIPIMVILLGNSLAQLQVSDLRLSVILSVARLGVGMAAGLLTIWILGLEGVEAGSIFLLSSMSCAMIVYLFAIRYNQAPRRIAGLIVVSTLLTFACLPVLLWIGIGLAKGDNPIMAILSHL